MSVSDTVYQRNTLLFYTLSADVRPSPPDQLKFHDARSPEITRAADTTQHLALVAHLFVWTGRITQDGWMELVLESAGR